MKKTTRLTALLLALVLLLANLSASATETTEGIPLEDLDMETYSTMLMTASEDGMLGEDLTDPCGTDNTYCQYIENEMSTMTAMEIYEYLTALYNDEEGYYEFIALMLHYGYYHLDDDLVCICQVPLEEPEQYPVGDLSAHTEADCPWKFENLTTVDQYAVVCLMSAEEQTPYLETLSEKQATALTAYSADPNPCDGEDCGYNHYMGLTTDVEQYKYLMGELYDKGNTLEDFMLHIYIYHDDTPDDICTCGVEVLIHAPGSTGHEDASCPWYNSTATAAEHYAAYSSLTSMANRAYYLMGLDEEQLSGINALMTDDQKAEMTYLIKSGIPAYLRTEAVKAWMEANENVSAEMVNRAYEVDAQLTASSAEYTALDALRLEGTDLISVETGAVIATYDETTGALTDCAMGLIVGYVVDGEIVSAVDTENE